MSEPNSADFALIKIQTAAGPPAVLALLCGIEGVTINRTAQTNETYRRDCAKPNRPGGRKLRVTGSSWSISGTGSDNIDLETEMTDAFGVRKTYAIELYRDDGTDGGDLIGTYGGTALMTTRNQSYSQDSAGTAEITLEGEGALTWTAAT
ncbi:phage tail tube protein [Novosphingobium sp.]|uniref:phage tail tube protein n=1 Tax=Novosphingobium sp. TaxID=1874826 RepID=UPI0028AFCF73|nr:phage tail tube protein [Novosphingobium sp.]